MTTIDKKTINQLIRIEKYDITHERTYELQDILIAQIAYSLIKINWDIYLDNKKTENCVGYIYATQIIYEIETNPKWNSLKKYQNKRLPLPIIFTLLGCFIDKQIYNEQELGEPLQRTPQKDGHKLKIDTLIKSLREDLEPAIWPWALWVHKVISEQAEEGSPLQKNSKEFIEYYDPTNTIRIPQKISYNQLILTIKTICHTNVTCETCEFSLVNSTGYTCTLLSYSPYLNILHHNPTDPYITKDSDLWKQKQ